jgi:hypothetical protein
MPIQRTNRFPRTVPSLREFMRIARSHACRAALGLAALLTCAAGAVQAAPLTADYTIASPAVDILYTLQDKPGLPQPLPQLLTIAGELNWTTVSGVPGLSNQFVTFCIELNQPITTKPGMNQYTYNVAPLEDGGLPGLGYGGPGNNGPLGTTKANEIRQLWGMHYGDVTDVVTAAAFQITIWEIVYGPYFTPIADNVPGDPIIGTDGAAAIALAASWLADVQTPNPSVYENNLMALTSPTAQDQIVLIAPVPAPGGFTLAAIGAIALLGYRRRTVK